METLKFSQFAVGGAPVSGDIIVGLRNGVNTQFNFTGGTGGNTTFTFQQTSPALQLGNWVYINSLGQFVTANASAPATAEIEGVITAVNPGNTYVLTMVGYVGPGVFTNLTPGTVYFLDTVTSGNMVTNDAVTNGAVSLPVFIALTSTSGFVRQFRGIIVGGVGPNPGNQPDSNVTTIVYPNQPFFQGQWIRVSNVVAGHAGYQLALADNLADSQSVGVVLNPQTNSFQIQFAGYNTGAVTGTYVDGGTVVPSTVYYLSPTTAGNITPIAPTGSSISKPLYISEQTTATTGVNTGWILPQRPIMANSTPMNPSIDQTVINTPIINTNPGWTDVGFCSMITTTSSTQSVLIFANVNLGSDGQNGVAYRLTRNGSPIDVGTAAGARTQASGTTMSTQNELDSAVSLFETYLDSPAAAGTYTYCIQVFKGNSSAVTVSRGDNDANASNFYRTSSTILLMLSGS